MGRKKPKVLEVPNAKVDMLKSGANTVQAGESIVIDSESYTVSKPCEDSESGYWYCLTHQKACANNLQVMFNHTRDNGCALTWMCFEHGPEAVKLD